MKRHLSVLLAVIMLLTSLPTNVFAVIGADAAVMESVDLADEGSVNEEYFEDKEVRNEDKSVNNSRFKEIVVETAEETVEEIVSVFTEEKQTTAETLGSRPEEIISMQQAEELRSIQMIENELKELNSGLYENDMAFEEAENGQLFANYYGISGTIRLPEGVSASAGDIIRLYVYDAPVVADGKVIKEGGNTSLAGQKIDLTQGQTSAAFSITGNAITNGNFEIAARYYTGNKNISGSFLYYSDYGLTENEYLAKNVSVKNGYSNEYLDMTFPYTDKYISGTIDLTNCIPQKDTYIAVSTYNESDINNTRQYAYILAKAGSRYVDFELGAKESSYYLYFSSDLFQSGYYSNGSITNQHNNRTIIDVEESVTNISVVIPERTATEEEATVKATINFSKPLDRDREIHIALTDGDGNTRSTWPTVGKGISSYTATFKNVDMGDVVYLSYSDATGCYSYYNNVEKGEYYYSRELGITSDISKATNVYGMTEITVTEPVCYEITGAITTTGNLNTVNEFIFVGAEFEMKPSIQEP